MLLFSDLCSRFPFSFTIFKGPTQFIHKTNMDNVLLICCHTQDPTRISTSVETPTVNAGNFLNHSSLLTVSETNPELYMPLVPHSHYEKKSFFTNLKLMFKNKTHIHIVFTPSHQIHSAQKVAAPD
ncbi:hypothetical protein AMECASPLE_037786 [Ameca splendens]|uniref:Uncharacterized protein n=1 Tax=Ameca splendens TaxID=208324 RepID=A0ABV1AEE4_9TELE